MPETAKSKPAVDIEPDTKEMAKLKKVGSVISLLERAREDAEASGIKDVEMIVTSALNIVFSTYYLHLRGEYMEKEDTWEINTSGG